MAAAVRYNRVNLKSTVNFLYRDHLHGQLEASSLPVSSSSRRFNLKFSARAMDAT
jgi:hypothetical protein